MSCSAISHGRLRSSTTILRDRADQPLIDGFLGLNAQLKFTNKMMIDCCYPTPFVAREGPFVYVIHCPSKNETRAGTTACD